MQRELTIYVISDSIGETGELIASAAVRQFTENYEIRRYPYMISEDQIRAIFEQAEVGRSLIIYTTVSEKTRDFIKRKGIEKEIPTVDVMTPPLDAIEKTLKFPPKRESGIIRRLDEDYFKKVEAVEFAVRYDDGKDPRGIGKSDICLVGVSRTSKTPLSMYLAHKNYKVANVPLVPEVKPPKELFEKDKSKLIGLIADPYKLNEIRKERLKTLGLGGEANYANVDRIQAELEYSKQIMKDLDCMVIDVSSRAIEETASIILNYMLEMRD